MKPMNLFAAVAIFVSGAAFGVVASNSQTVAQQVQAEAPLPTVQKPLVPGVVGKYQISAFGDLRNGNYGCYRIDTQTGETWLATGSGGKFRPTGN